MVNDDLNLLFQQVRDLANQVECLWKENEEPVAILNRVRKQRDEAIDIADAALKISERISR